MIPNSFAKAASGYLRHAEVQIALADWLAQWLPRQPAGRALEVGAGPGVFTRHLAHWPNGVTATDLFPEMCEIGRRQAPWARWQTMPAEKPLAGPWDWIFSNAMLQWTKQPETVFSGWREQLAPGGRVLSALFAAGSLPEWQTVGGHSPIHWREPAEWRAALAQAGLQLLRDETKTLEFNYISAVRFLRSLHGVGAAPERRETAGQLRKLLQAYESRYQHQNGVHATWVFWRFEAVRSA